MELVILQSTAATSIPWSDLPWGAIVSCIVVFGTALVFIVRADFRSRHNKKNLDDIVPKIASLDVSLSAMGERINNVQGIGIRNSADLQSFSSKLTKMSSNVDRIVGHLFKGDIGNQITKEGSPLILTEFGVELIEVSGGKDYIDDHFDELYGLFEFDLDNSYLDIQTNCYAIIRASSERQSFKKVKDFIYNNPTYQGAAISLFVMVEAIGIYLRDLVIKRFEQEVPENDLVDDLDEGLINDSG
ncbi:MAG: hypothetical protein KAR19_14400 [Bacteroidales bacterium]|nr:hypothetical protein [Bacteroidales bacterium]